MTLDQVAARNRENRAREIDTMFADINTIRTPDHTPSPVESWDGPDHDRPYAGGKAVWL